ncbi:MAG: adenine deaminase [Candidatus Saganbacteria bacterium]|nr:adenine deaminase [Candidatus Saganbacteria bacterium]
MNSIKERIAAALGNKKAELVLKNGQLINVFSGQIYKADVAIQKGVIAGIGSYQGTQEIDLNGRYLVPGFIDSHLNLESTMLIPGELARAVIPHGTTAVICDPHAIANVLGAAGVKFLIEASKTIPLDIYFNVPSCVPDSELETSGAKLRVDDVRSLLRKEGVLKLGDMINFPGVLAAKKEILEKIDVAKRVGVEGHAPGLSGKDLNAYICAGIESDHESTTLEEAREKLRDGLHIFVRESPSAKNLEAILPLISPLNSRYFSFCADNIYPNALIKGHIDRILEKAISLGLDPVIAIQMATINAAQYFNLIRCGAIAPGYFADINVLSNLEDFGVEMVFKRGKMVASKGRVLFEVKPKKNKKVRASINVKPFEVETLQIKEKSDYAKAIELVPGQLLTKSIVVAVKKKDGYVVSDPANDILKLVVVERHKASGNMGYGLVKGFGLRKGSLATSVSHDSHNIICVGVDDEDMLSAIRRVVELDGGTVAVRGGLVLAELALPIAGLISDEPLAEVVDKQAKLENAATDLGCRIENPFAALSFLALSLIPELRLTDKGLLDVSKFKIVDLFE